VFRKCGVRKKYKKMGYRIVCLNPSFYSEKDIDGVVGGDL